MSGNEKPTSELILYQTDDQQTRLEVRLQDETVWLTQKQMGELFQKDVRTINEHIQNIFEERELAPDSVIRKFRITAGDGCSRSPTGKREWGPSPLDARPAGTYTNHSRPVGPLPQGMLSLGGFFLFGGVRP